MKIQKIQPKIKFNSNSDKNKPQKKEFIDYVVGAVTNPRDANDCVAVPRSIFKAYLLIMAGSGTLAISSLLPQKYVKTKRGLNIAGWILNTLSAWFFAKPFAIKGLSPTVRPEDYNK